MVAFSDDLSTGLTIPTELHSRTPTAFSGSRVSPTGSPSENPTINVLYAVTCGLFAFSICPGLDNKNKVC